MVSDVCGNQIAALLVPTAVTLVTAYDSAGEPCVATIAWAMPISHEPSMMAVSIRPGGRTASAMAESGAFAINMLAAGETGMHTALVCGKKSGVDDRFAEAGIGLMDIEAKAPLVQQAISWVECELVEHGPFGDHELYIGKTLSARTCGHVDEKGVVAVQNALLMGQRGRFGHFEED